MFFKLSARNVKRSFKDYFIYFLTLTFAVCIFYSFNSLSDQKAMMNVSASVSENIKMLTQIISMLSVFVSIVLGFLIIFANNFLIKRRKKELGLYMSLGMSKYTISRILVVETFFVGMISLVAGLAVGILLSQGLSVLTAKMFEIDLTKFEFVFSSAAILKTVLYFGIIFLFVMIFNSVIISKYKLIDLLTAARKNESLKIRKTSTSVFLFIVSIIILGISYGVMLKYGLFESMTLTWFCVGLGTLGTFLFFMSLSGFMLNMLQRNKNIYFKDVNMFVLRQINSKVNTTFVSMTVISIMLFFTIGVLSTGFSLKNVMQKDLDAATPYDVSIYSYLDDEKPITVPDALKQMNIDVNQYGDVFSFNFYKTNTGMNSLLKPYADSKTKSMFSGNYDASIEAIKKSDYERLVKMQGKEPLTMGKNEVILLSNVSAMKDTLNRFIKDQNKITLDGQEYKISQKEIQSFSTKTDYAAMETLLVVVPDETVKNWKPSISNLNINYTQGNQEKFDDEFYKMFNSFMTTGGNTEKYGFFLHGLTRTLAYDMSVGQSTIFVFIGIYLGIVFLISSAAILALQQLSEASDNRERYTMLKKIGVTKKGINKAIFRQIFIYFMMPLSLAIVHSIFGIQVVNKAIVFFGNSSVLLPSLITGLIIVVVYGGYFLATYTGYKNIVK
ncbi:ABC transporter permease [Bacillus massiliigorillae]|uniref:ABC transporter permease n=1 Tax=Bacillus massiliigorillae TaxID=1243664 RepID=UPI0003AB0E8E|nr:ABC transporter permease [Bacillus massiliigorillae]